MTRLLLARALILFASLCGLACRFAQATDSPPNARPIRPMWTRVVQETSGGSGLRHSKEFLEPQVVFTGENTVVWCELEEHPEVLSRRELPATGESRYTLMILTMNIRTGSVIAKAQVATDGPDGGTLFPALGGLVLRTGSTVRFLSSTGDRIVKDVHWSDVRPDPPGGVSARVSRDGKRIVIDYRIDYRDPQAVVECEYDGGTFQLVRRHVLSGSERPKDDGDWYLDRLLRPLHAVDEVKEQRLRLDKDDCMMHVQVSTDHMVSAATVVTVHGEHKSWDLYGHYSNYRAVAFDTMTGKVFLNVPIKRQGNEPFAVELSPDGNWLILLNGRELSAYPVKN